MTSMKIFEFSIPHPPVTVSPKFFHPLDLGRPTLNEPSSHLLQQTIEQQSYRACEQTK